MSAGRRGLLLLATATLLLGCVMHEPYLDWSHYIGDAEVWENKDPGLGSPDDIYPRYFLIFPSFDAGDSQVHEFTSIGIPYNEYGFGLAVDTDSEWNMIRSSGVRLYVDIQQVESGEVLHLGGGIRQTDKNEEKGWSAIVRRYKGTPHIVLEPAQLDFSHRFKPNPFRRYVIRVRTELPATQASPSSTVLPSLRPVLWAGCGYESGW